MTMNEYLLWDNCTNYGRCKFCWQWKLHKDQCHLDWNKMIDSINKVIAIEKDITDLHDILIVGGEVYNNYDYHVSKYLSKLFKFIADRVKSNIIRYFYVNTNLLYDDLSVLDNLLEIFEGIRDHIRFTVSYDIYGRFNKINTSDKFLTNLDTLKSKYPDLCIVTNTILTKQACESILSHKFDVKKFWDDHKLSYMNFIPYIKVEDDRSMDPTDDQIVQTLVEINKAKPGYINFYIDDLDLNQDKILKEYHKDEGYVDCTASYNTCKHNKNFCKVLDTHECFICKLKELFR